MIRAPVRRVEWQSAQALSLSGEDVVLGSANSMNTTRNSASLLEAWWRM